MANVCCDSVYFYSDNNPGGLKELWYDLEYTVKITHIPEESWIGNLFNYRKWDCGSLHLRGNIFYMERQDGSIFVEAETAWRPMLDAYRTIAEHYNVQFALCGVESGELLYWNTDPTGRFFDFRYIVRIMDSDILTPNGAVVSNTMEDSDTFQTEEELLQSFEKLGFHARNAYELSTQSEEYDITIHRFTNPLEDK